MNGSGGSGTSISDEIVSHSSCTGALVVLARETEGLLDCFQGILLATGGGKVIGLETRSMTSVGIPRS